LVGSQYIMRSKSRGILTACVLSIAGGIFVTAIIASSDNGYAAGYVVLPLLILEILLCLILFLVGVVLTIQNRPIGLYLLLSVLLLPLATVGSATLAKQLELGAYRVEPMSSVIPPVANKIVFQREVSSEEVQAFWHEVLSQPSSSGSGEDHIPGIQTVSLGSEQNGSRTIVFSFFAEATEEQKSMVRQRIGRSPKVYQLLERIEIAAADTPK